jgi:hydrogenase/urease accessory protein HupE
LRIGWPLAHLVTTGLGAFYDGLGHLFLTPEDLLPLVALALLVGLRGAPHGRAALLAVPAAWIVGGLLGLGLGIGPPSAWASLSFVVVGGLVAADARLPLQATLGLSIVLGLFHGLQNGAAMADSGLGVRGLLGIVTSVFVLIALAAAFVSRLERPAARIAVRVAGSWVVAIGLFFLGWSLR